MFWWWNFYLASVKEASAWWKIEFSKGFAYNNFFLRRIRETDDGRKETGNHHWHLFHNPTYAGCWSKDMTLSCTGPHKTVRTVKMKSYQQLVHWFNSVPIVTSRGCKLFFKHAQESDSGFFAKPELDTKLTVGEALERIAFVPVRETSAQWSCLSLFDYDLDSLGIILEVLSVAVHDDVSSALVNRMITRGRKP